MREGIKYYFERSYPYIISIILFVLLYKKNINFIKNDCMSDAIDGVNTITSLIIGFLGAILPVILGMKNESKFVKYVFENDKNRLFLKYIRENILVGLMLLLISIILYFREEETLEKIIAYGFYLWISIVVMFLLVTYRCLSNMLNLIFSSDKELSNDLYTESDEDKRKRKMIQEEFIAKNEKDIQT